MNLKEGMDLRLYVLCHSAVYSGLLNHYTLNRYLLCALQLFEWVTLVNCSKYIMRTQGNR